MKFQLVSDLHLEFCENIPNITPKADYLILAGDVGYPNSDIFTDFMKDVYSKFKKVFFVAGNHEYYNKLNKDENDILIQNLSNEIGFEYLNNKVYKLDDLDIIGSTLWTQCNDMKEFGLLKMFMNDYNYIKKDNKSITPFDTGRWHYDSIKFLEKELKKDGKKLVITHHLPSYKMINQKYINNPANCGFATNLEHLFNNNIVAWCAGHTHEPFEGIIHNVPCYVNSVGYPNENKKMNYEYTFDI
jgi:predicted phosphohydrolase